MVTQTNTLKKIHTFGLVYWIHRQRVFMRPHVAELNLLHERRPSSPCSQELVSSVYRSTSGSQDLASSVHRANRCVLFSTVTSFHCLACFPTLSIALHVLRCRTVSLSERHIESRIVTNATMQPAPGLTPGLSPGLARLSFGRATGFVRMFHLLLKRFLF
jgi:hypothetical protein